MEKYYLIKLLGGLLEMKKFLCLLLVFVFAFVLVGCGECDHNYVEGKCADCGKVFKIGLRLSTISSQLRYL